MRMAQKGGGAVIDEYFERLVDKVCIAVPKAVAPWKVKFKNTGLGWRMMLYASALSRSISTAVSKINPEEEDIEPGSAPIWMDEADAQAAEREERRRAKEQLERIRAALYARFDAAQASLESRALGILLFMTALGALAVASTGRAAAGACAALCALLFAAEGMEKDYKPVRGGVRQCYLAAMLLRAAGYGVVMLSAFLAYVRQGVPNNVVLQSAMIVTITLHLALFVPLTAFNRRQMLMMRALSGVLGMLPALMAAACLALGASQMGAGLAAAMAGAALMAGSLLLFAAELIRTASQLGNAGIAHAALYARLCQLGGLMLLITGAFTGAY